MESRRLSTIKGGSRHGTCAECGANSEEEDLIRIKFRNQTSITLCKFCAKQLSIITKGFGEEK